MSLVKKRKENLFPSSLSEIFEDRFFRPYFPSLRDFWEEGISVPPANLVEGKNDFRIDLSAPGFSKEDFNVEMQDGALVISAEKEQESEKEEENYRRKEFSYNTFTRSFALPENVREDQINAKYENGMLSVVIPKKEVQTSRPKKEIMVA